jgi:hypothetical protein
MSPLVNKLIVAVIELHIFCESEGKDKIEIHFYHCAYSLHRV